MSAWLEVVALVVWWCGGAKQQGVSHSKIIGKFKTKNCDVSPHIMHKVTFMPFVVFPYLRQDVHACMHAYTGMMAAYYP